MQTVTIIAGNSDNKLSQKDWANLVSHLARVIAVRASAHEFTGGPDTASPFQNFAWVVRIDDDEAEQLRGEIKAIRSHYRQNSVAWISGNTEFI